LADGTYAKVASIFSAGQATLVASTYGTDAIALAPFNGVTFRVVNLADGTVTEIPATGLPATPDAGIDTISFQDDTNGLAQVTAAGCLSPKTDCYSNTTIYMTADGGYTWTAM
jgi:hypothetical protein